MHVTLHASSAQHTCSVIHRVVHKDKVHIVLMLMVEADFLHAALPQVQLNSHIQQLCAVIQLVRLCAMHVPVATWQQSHSEYLC